MEIISQVLFGILFSSIIVLIFYFLVKYTWHEEDKNRKKALGKFKRAMFDICDKESIYIEFFNDYYQLNEVTVKNSVDGTTLFFDKKGMPFNFNELAGGRYIYLKKEYDTPEKRVERQMPKIELNKNKEFMWTLAHELGHHFTIQYQNIETEEAANKYIKTLAEQLLTKKEQKFIQTEIEIYSSI
jgi:hypothetical protein